MRKKKEIRNKLKYSWIKSTFNDNLEYNKKKTTQFFYDNQLFLI